MDVRVVTAEPTEDLDQLTVGMVCVRNMQVRYYAAVSALILLLLLL